MSKKEIEAAMLLMLDFGLYRTIILASTIQ